MQFFNNLSGTQKAYLLFFLGVIQLITLHFILSPVKNSENKKSPGDVTIYFADNISPAQKDLIAKFNEQHKGSIKVELLNIPLEKFSSNERKQLFVKYLRSESERIDVFAIDQVWVPRFAKWSEPLDKYFSAPELDRILEAAKNVCTYKNNLVAIPAFLDIGVMYYREDLLEKRADYNKLKEKLSNSISWDDFVKLGREYSKSHNPFYTFPADNYEGLLCSFIELYNSNEKNLPESFRFDSVKMKSSMQFLSDLVNKYKISPAIVTQLQEANITKYFLDNNGIFLRGWPNTFSYYYPSDEQANKIKRLVKVPLPHASDGRKAFVLGGWNLMLSKYSQHKKEAAEFLKFWLQETTQQEMYTQNGFLPSIRKFYENEELARKYNLQFYNKIIPDAVMRPNSEYYTTYSNIISYYTKSVIMNDISVDKAVERAGKEINSIYPENNK